MRHENYRMDLLILKIFLRICRNKHIQFSYLALSIFPLAKFKWWTQLQKIQKTILYTYVVGKIDATTLVNNVAKVGKPVQLLSADKQPRNDADKKHIHHTRNDGRGNKFTASEKQKQHSNCGCGDSHHNSHKLVEKKEHKCEANVPPQLIPEYTEIYFAKPTHGVE